MAISPTFTTGQVFTAADANLMANSGLVFVKQVTVGSGQTTVDVTSCFNSSFDNYVISLAGISAAGSLSMSLALLSGSTPTSASWYGTEFFVSVGSFGINGQLSANNSGSAFCSAGSAASGVASTIDIQSPYLAQQTRFEYMVAASDYYRWGFAIHQAATSYDGLRFTTSGGTQITGGTITVYGRRKQ
jgi:hypothetical protein